MGICGNSLSNETRVSEVPRRTHEELCIGRRAPLRKPVFLMSACMVHSAGNRARGLSTRDVSERSRGSGEGSTKTG